MSVAPAGGFSLLDHFARSPDATPALTPTNTTPEASAAADFARHPNLTDAGKRAVVERHLSNMAPAVEMAGGKVTPFPQFDTSDMSDAAMEQRRNAYAQQAGQHLLTRRETWGEPPDQPTTTQTPEEREAEALTYERSREAHQHVENWFNYVAPYAEAVKYGDPKTKEKNAGILNDIVRQYPYPSDEAAIVHPEWQRRFSQRLQDDVTGPLESESRGVPGASTVAEHYWNLGPRIKGWFANMGSAINDLTTVPPGPGGEPGHSLFHGTLYPGSSISDNGRGYNTPGEAQRATARYYQEYAKFSPAGEVAASAANFAGKVGTGALVTALSKNPRLGWTVTNGMFAADAAMDAYVNAKNAHKDMNTALEDASFAGVKAYWLSKLPIHLPAAALENAATAIATKAMVGGVVTSGDAAVDAAWQHYVRGEPIPDDMAARLGQAFLPGAIGGGVLAAGEHGPALVGKGVDAMRPNPTPETAAQPELRPNPQQAKTREQIAGIRDEEGQLDRLEPQLTDAARQEQVQRQQRSQQLSAAGEQRQAGAQIADDEALLDRLDSQLGAAAKADKMPPPERPTAPKPVNDQLQARPEDVGPMEEGQRQDRIKAEQDREAPEYREEDEAARRAAAASARSPESLRQMNGAQLKRVADALGVHYDAPSTTVPRILDAQEEMRLQGMTSKQLWDDVRGRGLRAGSREQNIQSLLRARPVETPPTEQPNAQQVEEAAQPHGDGGGREVVQGAPERGQGLPGGGQGQGEVQTGGQEETPVPVAPQEHGTGAVNRGRKPFSRADLEQRLIDWHKQSPDYQAGVERQYTDESAAEDTGGAEGVFSGKIPEEVTRLLTPEEYRRARQLDVLRTSQGKEHPGGADALANMGDDAYAEMIKRRITANEGRSASVESAKEAATHSGDPAAHWLAKVHDALSGPAKERTPYTVQDAASIPAGAKFEFQGEKFRVVEEGEGMKVLKDDGNYPEVPLDWLDKVPVDKGTFEEKPAAPTSDTGVFGQDIPRPATGNKQGGLFHEPVEVKSAGESSEDARIRDKFKEGEGATENLYAPSNAPKTTYAPTQAPGTSKPNLPRGKRPGFSAVPDLPDALAQARSVRERFSVMAHRDGPEAADAATQYVTYHQTAETLVNRFEREAFKGVPDKEQALKDFVAIGNNNRATLAQQAGKPATGIPTLTAAQEAAIRAKPEIKRAIDFWNREVAPTLQGIRRKWGLPMDPNASKVDLFLNLMGEGDPASAGQSTVNLKPAFATPMTGEGDYNVDPHDRLVGVVAGHLRTDAAYELADAIRGGISINPNNVKDPTGKQNPATFPRPRKGVTFEAQYKGRTEPVAAVDLQDGRTNGQWVNRNGVRTKFYPPEPHYVPLRVAEVWNKPRQGDEPADTLADKAMGVATRLGIIADFGKHGLRVTFHAIGRLGQSGQSPLSVVPWLGSVPATAARMWKMAKTPIADAMQLMLDKTGSNRGGGFGIEVPEGRLKKIADFSHTMLMDPESGIDPRARRTVIDSQLRIELGNKYMDKLERDLDAGRVTPAEAAQGLEKALGSDGMLGLGRKVNATLGFANRQTRSNLLNTAQQFMPFLSSQSGMIPDEIRKLLTANLSPKAVYKNVGRGEYGRAMLAIATQLSTGPIGTYLMMQLANQMFSGHTMDKNEEGNKSDVQIVPDGSKAPLRYWGSLDPTFSRAARLMGGASVANKQVNDAKGYGKEVGREAINEAATTVNPIFRHAFALASGYVPYLKDAGQMAEARQGWWWPAGGGQKTVNALAQGRDVKPAITQDLASLFGITLKPGSGKNYTDAQRLAHDDVAHGPAEDLSPEDKAHKQARKDVVARMKADPANAQKIADDAVKQGTIRRDERATLKRDAASNDLQSTVRELPESKVEEVWGKMSDTERQQTRDIVMKRVINAKKIDAATQDAMLKRMGIDPPPDLNLKRELRTLDAKLADKQITPQERGRLERLRAYNEKLNDIRAAQKAGKITPERADELIRRVAKAA